MLATRGSKPKKESANNLEAGDLNPYSFSNAKAKRHRSKPPQSLPTTPEQTDTSYAFLLGSMCFNTGNKSLKMKDSTRTRLQQNPLQSYNNPAAGVIKKVKLLQGLLRGLGVLLWSLREHILANRSMVRPITTQKHYF